MICKSTYIRKVYSMRFILRQSTNAKKISLRQNKRHKKYNFFFRKIQLTTVLFLIHDFYASWSTRLISLKLYVAFSIFDSDLFLLKFKRKPIHSFASRPLIFKLQHEVWSDIQWYLETNFLNLENRSFEYIPFSQ